LLLILFKRFLGKTAASWDRRSGSKLELEQIVAEAQQGDERLREQLIIQYQPYVAKLASRFSKRYVDPARDDEFSVALFAFNEAIDQYDPQGGASFLGFAKTVIQRRLIDHARKEQRHQRNVPYSAFDAEQEEGSSFNSIDVQQAMDAHELARTAEERRAEIEDLNEALDTYGITFAELAASSPKHSDSRLLLIGIAQTLAEDAKLYGMLVDSARLPVKELTARCGVSRKTVERNRKYIIALAVIINGGYPYLNEYLRLPEARRASWKEASR
jgi:RNA polymerase sigma-I factor